MININNIFKIEAEDGIELSGYISKSEKNSKKILISTHGMTSNCFKDRDFAISKLLNEENIDYLAYNNRGSELVKYITKKENGMKIKMLSGTSYEDVLDSYYDIKAVINYAISLGYKEIYLQGHSLGCTKVLYTYNRLKNKKTDSLKYIKGIILLSLVNIPNALKIYLKDKFDEYVSLAEDKGKLEMMPQDSFIHPVSAGTFLRYAKYNDEIDFARYADMEFNYELLNSISVPLFMRWGNVNEMIEFDAKDLASLLNSKINNANKDISYIDGADHGYTGKEEILANEILDYLKRIV